MFDVRSSRSTNDELYVYCHADRVALHPPVTCIDLTLTRGPGVKCDRIACDIRNARTLLQVPACIPQRSTC